MAKRRGPGLLRNACSDIFPVRSQLVADLTQLPVMIARDAEAIDFARFNDVPTLPIEIPDGNFTISARTSDGRRITRPR